jgi:hypothetical protein
MPYSLTFAKGGQMSVNGVGPGALVIVGIVVVAVLVAVLKA